jgi:RNA polymerase sigma-70 factor (ECF subfamily)
VKDLLKDFPRFVRLYYVEIMPEPGTNRLRTRVSLLVRLKDWNDQASWQEFDDNYRQLIRNYFLKQGVTQEDAEDLVQATLFSVAKAIRKCLWAPEKGSFKSWLLTVAHNRMIDHFRRRPHWRVARCATRTATSRTSTIERIPDPRSLTPEAIWEEEWRNNVMKLALERLKARVRPKHFQIYHLHVIKQQPTGKVAKALGVRQGHVHLITHRLNAVIESLARKLERELEASPKRTVPR